MTVNKIRIKTGDKDRSILLPFATDFDESLGREQSIKLWERTELQDNINIVQDFETTRYSPDTDLPNKHIFYDIQFSEVTTPTGDPNNYKPAYQLVGITNPDIKTRNDNFIKSFFKFDFYDNPNPQKQRLYFSVVMPANNGKPFEVPSALDIFAEIINDPALPNYDPISYLQAELEDLNSASPTGPPYYYDKLESSQFDLASIGKTSENYYIQWLKKRDLVSYNIFYMSCKFFNAELGKTHKFINKPQPANTYKISNPDYFYYQLIFDPINFSYVVNEFDLTLYGGNNGVGPVVGNNMANAIKFYEYINA